MFQHVVLATRHDLAWPTTTLTSIMVSWMRRLAHRLPSPQLAPVAVPKSGSWETVCFTSNQIGEKCEKKICVCGHKHDECMCEETSWAWEKHQVVDGLAFVLIRQELEQMPMLPDYSSDDAPSVCNAAAA